MGGNVESYSGLSLDYQIVRITESYKSLQKRDQMQEQSETTANGHRNDYSLKQKETDPIINSILNRKLGYSLRLNTGSVIVKDDSEHLLSSSLSSRFICLFDSR